MQLGRLIALLLMLGLAHPATACTIGITTPGSFKLSGDGRTLSSTNSGGVAAILTITDLAVLSSTTITISNTRLDTVPSGFVAPVSYATTYSAGWVLGSASGSLVSSPSFTVPGVLNLLVTITLQNTVTSATGFRQGNYSTRTTVTCS